MSNIFVLNTPPPPPAAIVNLHGAPKSIVYVLISLHVVPEECEEDF